MLKLKRYLKPYIALFLGAIILLFGQALLELTLPNYMSDIVNVGLQQGGITYSAPEAIDAQSMQLMQLFMSEEDRETVEGVYTALSEGEQLTELQKTYPNLKAGDYALIEERAGGIDGAFSRASYALVQAMEAIAGQSEQSIGAISTETDSESSSEGTVDMAALHQLLPLLQNEEMLSAEVKDAIDSAIQAAAVTPESLISQTGPVMVKSIYQLLGADTDAIQTNYIIMDVLCLSRAFTRLWALIPTPSRPTISLATDSRCWVSPSCSPAAPSARASAWRSWARASDATCAGTSLPRSPTLTTTRWISFPPPR